MSGGKFDFGQIGQGRSALPVEGKQEKASKPAAPVPNKPKAKAKAKKPATSNETANVQIVFYMTPTEASRLKEMLDGRPVSSYMRKKVNSMIESGDV